MRLFLPTSLRCVKERKWDRRPRELLISCAFVSGGLPLFTATPAFAPPGERGALAHVSLPSCRVGLGVSGALVVVVREQVGGRAMGAVGVQ